MKGMRTSFVNVAAVGLMLACMLGFSGPVSESAQAQDPGQTASLSTIQGLQDLRAGRYDEAIHRLRGPARAGESAALSGWVTALRETGDYAAAIDASAEGIRRGTPGAYALSGAALLETGQIARARAALEAGATQPGTSGALARVELGILEYLYGDRDAARSLFSSFIDYYNSATDLSAVDLTAVGRALIYLSRWNYEYAHDALRALDEAQAKGPPDHAARLATGQLFLERYDANQAAETFRAILAENPSQAEAHLGLARVARLDGSGKPSASVAAALAANPNLAGARNLSARLMLLGGERDGALAEVERALQSNPAEMEALGTKAAILRLGRETQRAEAVMKQVRRLSPHPTGSLVVQAEIAADHRRYQEALDLALAAATADSNSWTGWGLAGLNQVRLGDVDAGRQSLERAFAGDPFNLWFKNTLELLDNLATYRTIETEHFHLVLHESEADLLAPYIRPLVERAYAEMSRRYSYEPPEPIRVEMYDQHADFSVRTVGLVGIGALGVSFGPALAMDSPGARRRGDFNWASTLWHEIAHSFHLGASENAVPRWFSEGLAVHEQRKAFPGWGHQASVGFVRSLAAGELRPVSELDRGFSNPRHPGEVGQSYYQASLVFELIEERFGFPAIVNMLRAYRDGASNEEAFRDELGVRIEEFDREFSDFLERRFASAMRAVGRDEPTEGPPTDLDAVLMTVARRPWGFPTRMMAGQALFAEGRLDEATGHMEAALAMFPQYGGPDGPHWFLGQIREKAGDHATAVEHYRALLLLNESHYDGRLALAKLLHEAGDGRGAAEILRQVAYIHPYEVADHERLAELLEADGDWEGATQERRAVLALDPVDKVSGYYKLARALLAAGDRDAARRALLAALEQAPNYEAALELLLEIRESG